MMVLLTGLFLRMNNGHLWAADGRSETITVQAALATLVGHHVRLALQHLPAFPLDPTRRGLGCCHVQGHCPLGHDDGQTDLYSLSAEGILRQDPWRVEALDGTVHTLDLDKLDGHLGRVAVSSITELDKLRGSLTNLTNQVQGLLPTGEV